MGTTSRSRRRRPTLSLFDTLDAAATALNNASLGAGALSQTVADGLRDIDAAAMQLGSARAGAGAWLQRLDNVESRVGRTEIARSKRAIECRRPGHGARHFRLSAQANGLRCRVAGLLDDAAPVPVQLHRIVMLTPTLDLLAVR